ncbi:MAG: ATP-binding cassette protein [Betaproteobacteria bacterium]|nr:ATP-binding cassette protein [Betaproteobacteria bacterium]
MPLVTLDNASLAYGHVPLLDRAEFNLDAGERVALIGRNGAGKSSLIQVMSGRRILDDGTLWKKPGLKFAVVDQEPALEPTDTAYEAVARGLAEQYALLDEYDRLLESGAEDDATMNRLHDVQHQLTETGGWEVKRHIDMALERLSLAPDVLVSACSGGMKKRIALAQALVSNPELLVLDEPTNHLDIDAIAWLENLLLEFRGAVLFVTHDRAFLDRVATRVIELDRGRLLSFPGNYAAYQLRKAEQVEVEKVVNAKFDKFLAQEEVWIRKGVQARRTRNEGRVLRLESLRRERTARRERQGRVTIAVDDGLRSGKLVAEFTNVSKAFGGKTVVRDLNLRILRGDKIGIIGPNGAGKSTLIKMMLGELEQDGGEIKRGTKLEIAYFDQFRVALNDEATLADTISPGSEWVEVNGARKHIMTYLSDFLFPPERANAKVGALSGGERNRLLLARLFARPANILVLDEPTNDLDIDTLELLETLLQDYAGTVILVSHDRAFLDNVVTQVLAYDGDGRWVENPGGHSEWQAYLARRAGARTSERVESVAKAPTAAETPAPDKRKGKMSYKDARELEALPGQIAALEEEQRLLTARLANPQTYNETGVNINALNARVGEIENELLVALERWEVLEQKR